MSPQVQSTFEILKYLSICVSVLGIAWAFFKFINNVTNTFTSLRLFLTEQVPTISGSLSELKEHADVAMSNHLPHLQSAAESIADEMKQQTKDFREHQLDQIQIQTEVKTELRSLNERLK